MQPTQTTPALQRPDEKTRKKLLTWGLISLIGPTALIVITIFLYALISYITSMSAGPAASGDADLFGPPDPLRSVVNIILFLVGIISILTWLPGIIVGIILLVKRQG